MEDVTVKDAKEHLEELLEKAARGEDVRIFDPRIGAVRLTPAGGAVPGVRKPRRLGLLEGKVPPPPDDFFDPLSTEELKGWYGEDA